MLGSLLLKAQMKYKMQYDHKAKPDQYRIGEWVLIKFPSEESGKQRKLSRPWHGPYRIMDLTDIDVTAIRIYFPEDGSIKVHQSCVSPCPVGFPAGYYWYSGKKQGPGHTPKWLEQVLQSQGTELDMVEKVDAQNKSDRPEEQDVQDRSDELERPYVQSNVDGSVDGDFQRNDSYLAIEPEVTQPYVAVGKRTRTREIRPPVHFRDQLRGADK